MIKPPKLPVFCYTEDEWEKEWADRRKADRISAIWITVTATLMLMSAIAMAVMMFIIVPK